MPHFIGKFCLDGFLSFRGECGNPDLILIGTFSSPPGGIERRYQSRKEEEDESWSSRIRVETRARE